MTIAGKGCFIWKIKDCEGGNPQAIAARAVEAEFSHVLVKIADGTFTYNYDWDQNVDLDSPTHSGLKKSGDSRSGDGTMCMGMPRWGRRGKLFSACGSSIWMAM